MYREPPRRRDAFEARLLWRRFYVLPLVIVAMLSALLFARAIAHARVTLTVHAYATARYEPPSEGWLRIPARNFVGAWELRSGFGDRETGELEAWYANVRVRDAHVMLEAPHDFLSASFYDDHVLHGPRGAPSTYGLGFESDAPRDRDDIARAFAAWENGPRMQPFEATWWTSPIPATWPLLAAFVSSVLLLVVLRRARVRASLEGGVVRIEVRNVFGARTEHLSRNEIRTITVETRVVGPISFARPLVVTTQGRKIPVGPCALSDVAAAALAHALPR
jgi:hypothetical protein